MNAGQSHRVSRCRLHSACHSVGITRVHELTVNKQVRESAGHARRVSSQKRRAKSVRRGGDSCDHVLPAAVPTSFRGHRQDALVDQQQQVGGLRGGPVEVGWVVHAVSVHEARLQARLRSQCVSCEVPCADLEALAHMTGTPQQRGMQVCPSVVCGRRSRRKE